MSDSLLEKYQAIVSELAKVMINICACDRLGLTGMSFCLTEGDEIGTGATDDTEEETSSNQMAGKSPNFCVLLHGSLKVEGMVALVQLG